MKHLGGRSRPRAGFSFFCMFTSMWKPWKSCWCRQHLYGSCCRVQSAWDGAARNAGWQGQSCLRCVSQLAGRAPPRLLVPGRRW